MTAEPGGTEGKTSTNTAPFTGVVLAGGRSRRLGRNKALEEVGGVPLLSRVTTVVESIASGLVLVVADEAQADVLPAPDDAITVLDVHPDSGSLGGIFTGLTEAPTDWALVVACDMPFLNVQLLTHMAGSREGADIVIPVLDGWPEPTHAFYSKTCLPPMKESLNNGRLKITDFFDSVTVKYLPQESIEAIDPERWSFFNVNTAVDLEKARARDADLVAGLAT
jgi:molybdopterin-guanine dinucleotide biosynthesis protein A